MSTKGNYKGTTKFQKQTELNDLKFKLEANKLRAKFAKTPKEVIDIGLENDKLILEIDNLSN